MRAHHDDERLIQRCRNGERAAWCELVQRYDRFVFSVALSTGLGPDDAADVTQMTFSALLEGLDQLRPDSRLPAWLATVAKRQAWRLLTRIRRESTGGNADVAWTVSETQSADSSEIERWEHLHGITCALDRLDRRCRLLLQALYFDAGQPSYEDIARQFDIPVGSVGPTRARCLGRLREIVDELEPQP